MPPSSLHHEADQAHAASCRDRQVDRRPGDTQMAGVLFGGLGEKNFMLRQPVRFGSPSLPVGPTGSTRPAHPDFKLLDLKGLAAAELKTPCASSGTKWRRMGPMRRCGLTR